MGFPICFLNISNLIEYTVIIYYSTVTIVIICLLGHRLKLIDEKKRTLYFMNLYKKPLYF